MKTKLLFILFFNSSLLFAGTGYTNDVELLYVLILGVLGIILMIWNGIDFISKNKRKIVQSISVRIERIIGFFRRFKIHVKALQ